ncbi:MAG: DNA primase [Alphaproteobacteria bacterium]|nr:DNA primase [Alphaproteobacteria bacterium]
MTTFSPAFLEEIRNRLSLSGVVGARVRLIRAGREFKGCCPFHNEKTPSFYVNDDKQFFHCFGCGAHGDVIGFTMRHDRLSFPEAVENLAAQAGMEMPRDTPVEREKYDSEKRLYQLLDRVTGYFEEQLFTPQGRDALAYLHKRGLPDEAIRRFRLGYAPNDGQSLLRAMAGEGYKIDELIAVGLAKKAEDRNDHYSFFRNRVMFPVGDKRGRTVAFGARVLGDGEPKYLNSPDHALFHKGKLLYGLSRARAALSQGQPIIVVEGYMDVISLAEAGYMGAVAPLGTALTEDQIQILWGMLPAPENRDAGRDYSPIVCFDGDNAGLRAAARTVERVLPLLTSARTLRIATLTGAKDPDELIRKSGKSAFDAQLKQALPMIDMLWNLTLSGRQIRTPEERGAFRDILRQRVMQIRDEQLRRLYGQEFKKRLDDAFGWQPPASNSPQRGGGKAWNNKSGWKGRPQPAPAPFINRSLPQTRQRQREKILLALMIGHPSLFDAFGENLANLDFQTPEFDALRRRIVDILSETHDAPPQADELRRALADHGEDRLVYEDNSSVLDEILSPETWLHAKGANPAAEIDIARHDWLAHWTSHEQDLMLAELESAKRRYNSESSDENWRRIMELQAQIHQFQRVAGES